MFSFLCDLKYILAKTHPFLIKIASNLAAITEQYCVFCIITLNYYIELQSKFKFKAVCLLTFLHLNTIIVQHVLKGFFLCISLLRHDSKKLKMLMKKKRKLVLASSYLKTADYTIKLLLHTFVSKNE